MCYHKPLLYFDYVELVIYILSCCHKGPLKKYSRNQKVIKEITMTETSPRFTNSSRVPPDIEAISNSDRFYDLLSDKDNLGLKYLFVDFSAKWCEPCKEIYPFICFMATRHTSNMKFIKVDVDENQDLSDKFKIDSLPTFIVFLTCGSVGDTKKKIIWKQEGIDSREGRLRMEKKLITINNGIYDSRAN